MTLFLTAPAWKLPLTSIHKISSGLSSSSSASKGNSQARAHVHVWVRYLRTHVEHAALWDELTLEIFKLFIEDLSYLEKNSNIVIE